MRRGAFLVLSGALFVTGCQAATGVASSSARAGRFSDAMIRAADDAAQSGMTRESLVLNERLYHDDPHNPEYILSYARSLRRAGQLEDALLVVRTPARQKKATEPMMTECAMVLVALGQYDEARDFARMAVDKNPKSPDALQALALSYSGLGDHAQAQIHFQEALALWPEGRDKTPVINNLAMAQAAQGKVLEARSTMALATGEALRSQVYQNNRSFLSSLPDEPAVEAMPRMTLEPVVVEPTPVSPSVPVIELPPVPAVKPAGVAPVMEDAPIMMKPFKVKLRSKPRNETDD